MKQLDELMDFHAGLVKSAEFAEMGFHPSWLEILRAHEHVIRVRRGWYARPGTPEPLMVAWGVGGRLTCVSAIAHHGLAHEPPQVHVLLARSRWRGKLPTGALRVGIVIHWRRHVLGGDRAAVDLEEARRQAQRCANL